MREDTNPHPLDSLQNEAAVFIGWQKTAKGAIIPLYNVIAKDHLSYGSTLSADGLLKLHLRIPNTPPLPMD